MVASSAQRFASLASFASKPELSFPEIMLEVWNTTECLVTTIAAAKRALRSPWF